MPNGQSAGLLGDLAAWKGRGWASRTPSGHGWIGPSKTKPPLSHRLPSSLQGFSGFSHHVHLRICLTQQTGGRQDRRRQGGARTARSPTASARRRGPRIPPGLSLNPSSAGPHPGPPKRALRHDTQDADGAAPPCRPPARGPALRASPRISAAGDVPTTGLTSGLPPSVNQFRDSRSRAAKARTPLLFGPVPSKASY